MSVLHLFYGETHLLRICVLLFVSAIAFGLLETNRINSLDLLDRGFWAYNCVLTASQRLRSGVLPSCKERQINAENRRRC